MWSLDDLARADLSRAVAWITPAVRARVDGALNLREVSPEKPLPDDADTLIVVGGGSLIDRAKHAAKHVQPYRFLIAVPSVWGSGAEASSVVVLNRPEGKLVLKDARYLPDVRMTWPELGRSVPLERAKHACGDCWAHAVEALLSPLGNDALRSELAELICEMSSLPLGYDARWFEMGAQSCAASARSGVGLIHGIAHVLEPVLQACHPDQGWHHARLCACLLWPVLQWSRRASESWLARVQQYALDETRILAIARMLHDSSDYAAVVAQLASHAKAVLRDPCTRMNGVLVRPSTINFLCEGRFS